MSICTGVGTLGDTTESIEVQLPLEGCELPKLRVERKEWLESSFTWEITEKTSSIHTHLGMPKVSWQYITNKPIIIPNSKCITLG